MARSGIVTIPNLEERLLNGQITDTKLGTMLGQAKQQLQSTNLLAIDAGYGYDQKQLNLTSLDGLIDQYKTLVAAIADIPVTKIWGTSADGMNATGEGDHKDYNVMLASIQKQQISPALRIFDKAMLRSCGIDPAKATWNWNTVFERSNKEKLEETKILVDMLLAVGDAEYAEIPDADIGNALSNALMKNGFIERTDG